MSPINQFATEQISQDADKSERLAYHNQQGRTR